MSAWAQIHMTHQPSCCCIYCISYTQATAQGFAAQKEEVKAAVVEVVETPPLRSAEHHEPHKTEHHTTHHRTR